MFYSIYTKATYEDILKYSPTDRCPFVQNKKYTINAKNIINKLEISTNDILKYINSSYSRYDSTSMYYFLVNSKIIEIALHDNESIDELVKIIK